MQRVTFPVYKIFQPIGSFFVNLRIKNNKIVNIVYIKINPKTFPDLKAVFFSLKIIEIKEIFDL